MEEFQKFDIWVSALDLEWNKKDQLLRWLKEREDAQFRWAWNRAHRRMIAAEKSDPLIQEESDWLSWFEITVENVVEAALYSCDELLGQFLDYVNSDFQLLARAARLRLSDPWLDKLRGEYEAGRFPCGKLI